jgi:sodium-dependent dicarboxylate transporter 2/3/5
MTRAAWITLAVFACAAGAWVAVPLLAPWTGVRLRDGQIAVAAAIVLLAVPAGRGQAQPVVPWPELGRLPLGVFLLFGGGLALADAMQRTGVSDAIAASLTGLSAVPEPLLILLVVLVMVFASEIASNTALAATAVPIVGAMAAGLGVPAERLVIAAALGASYAFMLPVGTPPNAIVYATGRIPLRAMLRAGLVLNIIAAAIVTAACLLLV